MNTKLDELFFENLVKVVNDYLQTSMAGVEPVVKPQPLNEISEALGLKNTDWKLGHESEDVLLFVKKYLEFTTRLHHPGFISHQVGLPHPASAAADLINGVTNNGMGVYEMGPGGVVAENFVVEWLNKKVGWSNGAGVLVQGGSLANLTALLCARSSVDRRAWESGVSSDYIFFVPETSHYSVARAICIMGYGTEAIWAMPTDQTGRVMVDELPAILQMAKDKGKTVVALTCNACATATGLYDRIDELAEFCATHNIWFHVDGAHGASALISENYKHLMAGVEKADSLVWDMHKMLQTSALCAAVLYKDSKNERSAFQQDASYLQHEGSKERDDMFEKSIECTKVPIGFRFLLNLYANGEDFFSQFIDDVYGMTMSYYDFIDKQEDYSCPVQPDSNILLFRYKGGDSLQDKIYEKLLRHGEFYITKARFNAKTYLRLTVMNRLTDQSTITRLLETIRSLAQ